jgi:septal ring factor EnvC (AmiA/AmiB activator)
LITELNNELYQMEMEIDLNTKLSRDLDKKLEYMKTDYERVVYLAYKNRKFIDKITFLLSADNFSQMYRRARYYNIFSESVKTQVVLINKTKEEIEKKNAEIEILKNEKVEILEGKEKEVKNLERDRTTKTRSANQLKKRERELVKELKAKQKRRAELDRAIKRAIEAEIKAENERKRAAAAKKPGATVAASKTTSTSAAPVLTLTPEEALVSNSFVNNKGKLPWPVAKGSKISDFGTAPHPDVPSIVIDNKGIDILVEPGTQVRAIFDGVVSGVLDMGGTKVVMIRHGEYLTVYQNLATVTVKKGDKIKTKQIIGTVAKVPGGSGYELHFEVWKKTSTLNPSQWLSSKY